MRRRVDPSAPREHHSCGGTRGTLARTSCGARGLAPRGLGSGRRAGPDAEERRNSRLCGQRARLPQRFPRRSVRAGQWGPARLVRGLQGRVQAGSRLHASARPRLERRVHEEAALFTDVPHPPPGPLERRGRDQREGLRLYPSRDPEVPSLSRRPSPDAGPQCPRPRREDGQSGPPRGLRRLAKLPIPPSPAAACPHQRGLEVDLGGHDRQSEDGPAHWKRPLPRRALGARKAADPRSQRALLGSASGLPQADRVPIRRSW